MEVLQRMEEFDGEVKGKLTAKFVFDWRQKIFTPSPSSTARQQEATRPTSFPSCTWTDFSQRKQLASTKTMRPTTVPQQEVVQVSLHGKTYAVKKNWPGRRSMCPLSLIWLGARNIQFLHVRGMGNSCSCFTLSISSLWETPNAGRNCSYPRCAPSSE